MMKKRKYPTSLIILAVLGALFLYVKFFEKGAKKEEGQVQVFALDRNSVTRIELNKNNKEIVLIKESNSGKWMFSPKNVLARKDVVDAMLDELSDFTAERKISEDLKDIKLFGLAQPKYFFNAFQGNTMIASVIFGDNSPVGGFVYMKEDKKPALYTVMSYRADKFNKVEQDLRELKLTFFETEKLNEMIIKAAGGELAFSKYGGEWHLTKPRSKAMKEAAPALINHLLELQAKSFADDHPNDLKKYALDMPLYIITLKGDGKEQTLKLSKAGSSAYALSSENPSVAVVDGDMLKKVDEVIKEAKKVEKKEENKTAPKSLTPALKTK